MEKKSKVRTFRASAYSANAPSTVLLPYGFMNTLALGAVRLPYTHVCRTLTQDGAAPTSFLSRVGARSHTRATRGVFGVVGFPYAAPHKLVPPHTLFLSHVGARSTRGVFGVVCLPYGAHMVRRRSRCRPFPLRAARSPVVGVPSICPAHYTSTTIEGRPFVSPRCALICDRDHTRCRLFA
jgi:hypothetical protein